MTDVGIDPDGEAVWEWIAHDVGVMLLQLLSEPAAKVAEHTEIPSRPGVYLFSKGDRTVMVGLANDLNRALHAAVNPDTESGSPHLSLCLARSMARKAGVDVDRGREYLEAHPAFLAKYQRAKEIVRHLSVRFITHQNLVERQVLAVYSEIHLNAAIPSRLIPEWDGPTFVHNPPSVDRKGNEPPSIPRTVEAGPISVATDAREPALLPWIDLEDVHQGPWRTLRPSPLQLGQAIKHIRTERHLTQEQVADRAFIHPSHLSFIETGKRSPSWKVLTAICAGLEVPIPALVARAEQS